MLENSNVYIMDKRIAIAPITTHSRVTLPGPVMERLKVEDGDLIGFYDTIHGILIKKMKVTDDE